MPQDIKNQILEKVKTLQPRSKLYFTGQKIGLIILLVCLTMIASFLFGFVVWDFVSQMDFTSFYDSFLFEFWLLIIAIATATFVIYRQTDFFLVKHRLGILLIITFLIICSGLGIFWISRTNASINMILETVQINMERLPYREGRQKKMQNQMLNQNQWQGRLIEIRKQDNNQYSIKVQNRLESKVFVVDREQLLDIKKGDFVRLKFDPRTKKVLLLSKGLRILPFPSRPL